MSFRIIVAISVMFLACWTFACESSTNYTPSVDGDGETDIKEADVVERDLDVMDGDVDNDANENLETDAEISDSEKDSEIESDPDAEPEINPNATQELGERCELGNINAGAGECREGECIGIHFNPANMDPAEVIICSTDSDCTEHFGTSAQCMDYYCAFSFCSMLCNLDSDCSKRIEFSRRGFGGCCNSLRITDQKEMCFPGDNFLICTVTP